MKKQEVWKYEIGTGKTPVVASVVMLLIFGGLTLWLYKTNNGAFLFAGALAGIMVLLVYLTLYRLCFYQIKIGKDAFFYQTNHKNGKIYSYHLLKKAWTSEGREQNGYRSSYCNVDTGAGVIRFSFFYGDRKAVKYLLERVEKTAGKEVFAQRMDTDEYVIDGRVYGKSRIVLALILWLVVVSLEKTLFCSIGSVMMALVVLVLVVRYVCFQIKIGENGVFVQTMPWNGAYYSYREITDCREIEKVVRHGRRGKRTGRTYYYFFTFTSIDGETRRFQFEKPLHAQEITVLKERIEKKGDRLCVQP